MPKRKRGNLTGKREATRQRIERASVSDEQREERLAQRRAHENEARANESAEQRAERLARMSALANSRSVVRARASLVTL